jgi:hypothetical protein
LPSTDWCGTGFLKVKLQAASEAGSAHRWAAGDGLDASAPHEMHDDQDERDDQNDVDGRRRDMECEKAKQPEDHQYRGKDSQHLVVFR